MNYDFTTQADRRAMSALKYFYADQWNPNLDEDVVPLATADMEFQNAPEIQDGLKEYIDQTILGYTRPSKSYFAAIKDWMKRRHQWEIEMGWIIPVPGVVTAIALAIQTFTQENDGVIIFRPVYQQFGFSIDGSRRKEVNVPLIEGEGGHYDIDFEAFEEAAAQADNKILIFCSPHNPVGRVWTRQELEKVADIAHRHDVLVISDEIWHDIVFEGHTHTAYADVSDQARENVIVCTSVSKSFNLAGINTSNIIIPNDDLRQTFQAVVKQGHYECNAIGYKATELAYNEGEAWLEECLDVLYDNHHFINDYFAREYPKIKTYIPEGTYVSWLDFRDLNLSDEALEDLTYQEAQFMCNQGTLFGAEDGAGFERINLALPQSSLKVQLDRLVDALNNYEK